MNKNFLLRYLLFFLFVLLGAANILSHELWRDEFQAFLIARESTSVADLFDRASYEGHPPLWFLLLFLITRFTADPLFMQLFHYILACIAVFVIFRLPIPGWQKYTIGFGYFALYEYLAISRNYVLGFLFCAVVLKLILQRPRSYPLISLVLFALCMTSVYGIILAASIVFYLSLEMMRGTPGEVPHRPGIAGMTAVLLVALSGALLSTALILPPPDSFVETAQWFSRFDLVRFARVITAIWKSYVPVPELSPNFWDTHLLESRHLRVVISLAILLGSLALFFRKRNVFLLYSFGTLSLFAFSYFKFSGYLRHQGHFYILFMMCLVLANQGDGFLKNRSIPDCAGKLFIALILSLQVTAGAAASVLGWVYPFSAARDAARYIKEQGMDDYFIMGDRDYALTTLSGYLGRPLFHLSSMKLCTYVTWNAGRQREIEPRDIAGCAEKIEADKKTRVLVVLNYPLPESQSGNLLKVRQFTRSVKKDETYYLYVLGQ